MVTPQLFGLRQTHRYLFCLLLGFGASLWSATGLAAEPGSFVVTARIVSASQDSDVVDAELKPFSKYFSQFKFSSFRLLNKITWDFSSGPKEQLKLPNGDELRLEVLGYDPDERMRIRIILDKEKLKVQVALARGASVAIGGPKYQSGSLILIFERSSQPPS